MAPLAASPNVQNAIATDVSNQISSKVDIQALVARHATGAAVSCAGRARRRRPHCPNSWRTYGAVP
jgi:hypothetical protein